MNSTKTTGITVSTAMRCGGVLYSQHPSVHVLVSAHCVAPGETEDVGSDGEPSGTGSRVQTGVRKSHGHTTDELKWDHKVNLIGRPVKDPLLHICETCSLPILIYGRMVRLGVVCGGYPIHVTKLNNSNWW